MILHPQPLISLHSIIYYYERYVTIIIIHYRLCTHSTHSLEVKQSLRIIIKSTGKAKTVNNAEINHHQRLKNKQATNSSYNVQNEKTPPI